MENQIYSYNVEGNRRKAWFILLGSLAPILMFFVAFLLLTPFVLAAGGAGFLDIRLALGVSVLAELITLVILLHLTGRLNTDIGILKQLYFNPAKIKHLVLAAFGGVGLFVGLQLVAKTVSAISGQEVGSSDVSVALSESPGKLFVLFILVPFVVPMVEELLFRVGICSTIWYGTSNSKRGQYLAIALSTFWFGVAHYQGFSSVSDFLILGWTALVGGINAALLTKTRSVWVPFMLHCVYNLITVLAMLFL